MDKYVKSLIEETFKSKKQQRFFYAKANDKSLPKKDRKKWGKWAKEFSDDTDYKKIPDEVENDVDEIVDVNGNIARKKVPVTKASGGASQKTTDQAVKSSAGSMGTHGVHGTHTSLRYWAESDMSKALGFEKTMGQDKDMEDAEEYFEKDLGVDDKETEERLNSYGYDENLPDDKVRLIENPKEYIRDYVESVLNKKTSSNDFVKKDQTEDIEVELEPIIKKQISALKNTLSKNNVPVEDVIKMLKKNDE